LVVANHCHISIQFGLKLLDGVHILAKNLSIAVEFKSQLVTRIPQLMAVVDVLDGLLEADGYEETDSYRRDVYEEVFPRVETLMGSVDVEHWLRVLPVGLWLV
jgi:hypothetical protein